MNKGKHILFISKGLGLGGAQKMLVFVANGCASAGHKVSILSLRNQESSLMINENIQICNFNFFSGAGSGLGLLEKTQLIWSLRKYISRNRPDLIVVFLSDIVRIAVLSTFGLGIPIIASERADPSQYSKKLLAKYNRAYDKCKAVVFQTENAQKSYPVSIRKKSAVIPNPYLPRLVDIPPYTGNRKRVIVAAGRLEKQKRFDILIRAFHVVHSKYSDYSLNIYGDGPLKGELDQLIHSLNLGNAALLKGASSDFLAEAYDTAMFVLSSDYEGIPNVLLEAMGIGMPCISTDCEPGGPRMLFDNERRGILVPIESPKQMADAICRYIEEPALSEQKGRNALEVKTQYKAESISQEWLQLINRYLGK